MPSLFTTSQVQRIERTSQLFVRRLYESAFIDLSLLLNTKMKVPRAQNQERWDGSEKWFYDQCTPVTVIFLMRIIDSHCYFFIKILSLHKTYSLFPMLVKDVHVYSVTCLSPLPTSALQSRWHTELCDLSLCHHVAWDLWWDAEDSHLHVQVTDTVSWFCSFFTSLLKSNLTPAEMFFMFTPLLLSFQAGPLSRRSKGGT